MESKIIIFESGKDIGIMSAAPKFYEENIPEEERKELFHQNRIKLGNKYNFDGNKIFHANQKSVTNKLNYPDGHYILLNDKFMDKEDYLDEEMDEVISKEEHIMNHLEDTYKLVGKLNYREMGTKYNIKENIEEIQREQE